MQCARGFGERRVRNAHAELDVRINQPAIVVRGAHPTDTPALC